MLRFISKFHKRRKATGECHHAIWLTDIECGGKIQKWHGVENKVWPFQCEWPLQLTFSLSCKKLQRLKNQVRPTRDRWKPHVEGACWRGLPHLNFLLQLSNKNVGVIMCSQKCDQFYNMYVKLCKKLIPLKYWQGFLPLRWSPIGWRNWQLFPQWKLGYPETPPQFCNKDGSLHYTHTQFWTSSWHQHGTRLTPPWCCVVE